MMDPIIEAAVIPSLLAEIKYLYSILGIFVALFSIGGAWAMIKFGIKDNSRRIVSLEESRGGMYDKLGEQGEAIAAMGGRFDGIETQLSMIYKAVRNSKN